MLERHRFTQFLSMKYCIRKFTFSKLRRINVKKTSVVIYLRKTSDNIPLYKCCSLNNKLKSQSCSKIPIFIMERWKGKVAVVTGASAGIGASLVEKLVQTGVIVAGLARRKERVENLSKKLKHFEGKLYPVQCDVTKESEIIEAFKWIKTNLGPIHILVNNAGISRNNTLIDGNSEMWREVFDTNVIGLCVATREAIEDMKLNNVDGHIVHINSIKGHKVQNLPKLNVYPASKFAVRALTETLRYEILQSNLKIKTTNITPGSVKTELFEASGYDKELTEFLGDTPPLKSEEVADSIMYALATPPNVQILEVIILPLLERN